MTEIETDLRYEWELHARGLALIAGLDEAGRGAWAGPVAAGAVILPLDRDDLIQVLDGVTDSKRLSANRRAALYPVITETALAWGVGFASNTEIDEIGIVPATRLAMRRALDQLSVKPAALLTDSMHFPEAKLPYTSLIKGDQKSLSIAAASILAKVSRDHFMIELDEPFPAYKFGQHKGYGTELHRLALREHGPCVMHRQTFAPVVRARIAHQERA
ncbi:MAG: ribonuclease HII [Anaerolineae bacterium]|nr:ribonuclease HII [Anaerolineae bacterium]